MTQKVFLSWSWVDDQLTQIQKQINIEYQWITGLPRGGLIPAVMLSHRLNLPYIPFHQITNEENILLVDDISDSGVTLKKNINTNVDTATLALRYTSEFTPDYFGTNITDDRWLVFPWETLNSESKQDYLVDSE